jgi:hypothetical protein
MADNDFPEEVGGDCSLCGKATEPTAGDPGKWDLWLPCGNGKRRPYHYDCVIHAIRVEEIKRIASDSSDADKLPANEGLNPRGPKHF